MTLTPETFNNIVTPILSFVALIVYAVALFMTINQNKILLSQNLKPHYEGVIEELKLKGEELKIADQGGREEFYNSNTFISGITSSLSKLASSPQFQSDYGHYKTGERFTADYFKSRDYYARLLFLSEFTLPLNSITMFYHNVLESLHQINDSKLIEEDKQLLRSKIKRMFFKEYLSFIEFGDRHERLQVPFPIIYGTSDNHDQIEFKILAKTGFRSNYDLIKRALKE